VPATLLLEKKTNPFLRCDQRDVIEAVSRYTNQQLNTEVEVFSALREWKNKG
jgi:hydroxyacylglutathione hydrolase